MAAVTWTDVFEHELAKLLEEKIDGLKDDLSRGNLETHADYMKMTGKIAGLRAAIEGIDEAHRLVDKKLR